MLLTAPWCRYQLNHKLLGYDYFHVDFSFQNFTRKKRFSFIEYVKSLKNTFYVNENFGKYAIECEFLARSQTELHELIIKIKEKFPGLIKEYNAELIYDVYKAF